MRLIIGNVIALIASILIIIVSYAKNKKQILILQTTQVALLAISNFILGGIPGAIINAITVVRNILCYKEKLTNRNIAIITILLVTISLYFNNLNLIGLLPLISTVLYTIYINTKSTIKLKLLILLNMICWGIYDFIIMSYTSAIFQFIAIFTGIISIYQLISKKETNKKAITCFQI